MKIVKFLWKIWTESWKKVCGKMRVNEETSSKLTINLFRDIFQKVDSNLIIDSIEVSFWCRNLILSLFVGFKIWIWVLKFEPRIWLGKVLNSWWSFLGISLKDSRRKGKERRVLKSIWKLQPKIPLNWVKTHKIPNLNFDLICKLRTRPSLVFQLTQKFLENKTIWANKICQTQFPKSKITCQD